VVLNELIPILAIFFGLGVPAVSLATHFVLRPLVKDIVEALRSRPSSELVALRQRVEEQHEELARLEARLEQLAEAESFHRRLESGDRQS
jgi:hypothetical protein